MRRIRLVSSRTVACLTLFAVCILGPAAHAVVWEEGCLPDGVQNSGALYRICLPALDDWNGDLVLWCHGYTRFDLPLALDDTQIAGISISELITSLGYAFATTSYSRNGLAFVEGVADIEDLTQIFINDVALPENIFVIGGSEGGYITTKSVEEFPDLYAGGFGVCGPIGSFPFQVNFFGDFRIIFDVFFPGLLPGDGVEIPEEYMTNWEDTYQTIIRPLIFEPVNVLKLLQLVKVTSIPYDTADFWATVEKSIHDALWYNVYATNDATAQLGGQPFDNSTHYYTGSMYDALLNFVAQRFTADPAAVAEMASAYTTSGVLEIPLVNMHTTGDQQIPFFHQALYRWKVMAQQSTANHIRIPIDRYGHCNFTVTEILIGFGLMVNMATGDVLDGVAEIISDGDEQREFIAAAENSGLVYLMERDREADIASLSAED